MTKDQMDMSDIPGFNPSKLTAARIRYSDVVLQYCAAQKMPLSLIGDERHMNLSQRTLKQRARQLGLSFPDYVPRRLRKKAVDDAAV